MKGEKSRDFSGREESPGGSFWEEKTTVQFKERKSRCGLAEGEKKGPVRRKRTRIPGERSTGGGKGLASLLSKETRRIHRPGRRKKTSNNST